MNRAAQNRFKPASTSSGRSAEHAVTNVGAS